jgi:hypothetical protein
MRDEMLDHHALPCCTDDGVSIQAVKRFNAEEGVFLRAGVRQLIP